MGHTIYYSVDVKDWEGLVGFIVRVCNGLGLETVVEEDSVTVFSDYRGVEALRIPKEGSEFVKTNLVEPCHSIYLLILHSVSSFGEVEVWED